MNIQMIRAAATRLDGHVRRTPLLTSPFLDELAGRRVLVKPECLQHTGSFKYRGAWSAISALPENARSQGVIAYSSGNHAQGVALAARQHNIPALIVMPADAPEIKVANTRALGAEVVLYNRATESREEVGDAIARERGFHLIRPFDDPQVIAGQASVGLELAEQTRRLGVDAADTLVCCGGGGLTAGIALALEAEAPNLRTRPVEPEGFDDVARSLRAGSIVQNEQQHAHICDAILTARAGDITFPIMSRICGPGIAVSVAQVRQAMALAFSRLKIVVEPGGAVALAAALFHGDDLQGDTVICIASGGNVDPALFAEIITESNLP